MSRRRLPVIQEVAMSPAARVAVVSLCAVILLGLGGTSRLLASAAADELAAITGTLWKWQGTLMNDDSRRVPDDPAKYTLRLDADGSLSVQADCNVHGGTYTASGQQLALTVTHGTMAMCPPDSLDQAYLKDLSQIRLFLVSEGQLFLDLPYDSGTMRFAP